MEMKRKVAVGILCALLLSGCAGQETAEIPETEIWETAPVLTYGVMTYEKLEILPWYAGRAEAVNKNYCAETESGFYIYHGNYRYIDKDNPVAWVPLCNKPNCIHLENSFTCNAYSGSGGSFVVRNQRIYFTARMEVFPQLCPQEYRQSNALAIFSKAMDGTDVRMEYMIEDDALYRTGAGGYTNLLSAQGWFWNIFKMNTDGTFTAKSYFLSSSGLKLLFQENFEEKSDAMATIDVWQSPFYGDPVFYNYALGRQLYAIRDGEVYAVNAAQYADGGGYLSGNVLRQFRMDDGYYDIRVETGEEVFLAPARLKNSVADIMLPNCIVETTLGSPKHPAGEEHALEIFDGEQWHRVALPEELQYGKNLTFFAPVSVASDRILFIYQGESGRICYQVKLGQESWTLEPFGQVS